MKQKPWPAWYHPKTYRGNFMEQAVIVLGVPIEDIRRKSRTRLYTRRRFAIAHVMRDSLNYSYRQIGDAIDLKDHTSVIHGIEQSREFVKRYPEHAAMVDALEMIA